MPDRPCIHLPRYPLIAEISSSAQATFDFRPQRAHRRGEISFHGRQRAYCSTSRCERGSYLIHLVAARASSSIPFRRNTNAQGLPRHLARSDVRGPSESSPAATHPPWAQTQSSIRGSGSWRYCRFSPSIRSSIRQPCPRFRWRSRSPYSGCGKTERMRRNQGSMLLRGTPFRAFLRPGTGVSCCAGEGSLSAASSAGTRCC